MIVKIEEKTVIDSTIPYSYTPKYLVKIGSKKNIEAFGSIDPKE